MGGDYMKVQVNISDDMVEKIDSLANKMGVSRSSLCAMAVGQYILSFEKSMSILENMGTDAVKFLKDSSLIEK